MADRKLINALVISLIDGTFRCLDAAAEAINARLGGAVAKGTLSRKASQQLDWTIAEVMALEDAAGRFPVTRMMARRLSPGGPATAASMMAQAGVISKETGEAVASILSASASADAQDRAEAIREIDEAIVALKGALRTLEAHDA